MNKLNREELIEWLDYYNKNKHYANVPFEQFISRIEKNYDTWMSLVSKKIGRKCTKEYQKWLKIADMNGIGEETFYGRITVHKMEYSEAATKDFLKKHIPEFYTNQAYMNGIPDRTFRHRVIALNWSLERASTEPIDARFRGKNKSKQVETTKRVDPKVIKLRKQIEFYTKSGLPLPKKFVIKAKEYGLELAS